MKKYFVFLIIASFFLLMPGKTWAQSTAEKETRAVWLNKAAFDSDVRRTTTLNDLKRGNFNTIFLIAPPIYGNFGEGTPANFSAMLTRAKDEGFQVHAWIANYMRTGDPAGVDFTSQAERNAQVQWTLYLLSAYPQIDGIHLDYIRYPETGTTVISKAKREGVNQTVKSIYQAMKQQYPEKFLSAAVFAPGQSCVVWSGTDYRPEQETMWNNDVPSWYKNWFNAQITNSRWKNVGWGSTGKVCAKAVPDGLNVQQDPVLWLTEGYLDRMIYMAYDTFNNAWYEEWWTDHIYYTYSMLDFNKVSNYQDKLYMSIGWYVDTNYTPANIATIIKVMKEAKKAGVKGISVFEIGHYIYAQNRYINDNPLIDALTINSSINSNEAPFILPAQSHFSSIAPAPCSPLASSGDFNCDGKINESDLNSLLGKWMTSENDITGDGKVNESDLNKLLGNWKTN
ncbi:hypothetical protein MUP32_04945 [Candidatus Microgenomates bacterium]|nr:hypothetical protein [Candidatus Microgenomates bacterium]